MRPETKEFLKNLGVIAALGVAAVFILWLLLGCEAVPVSPGTEQSPAGNEVMDRVVDALDRFNKTVGPLAAAVEMVAPAPVGQIIQAVGGFLLAFVYYQKRRLQNIATELVQGWDKAKAKGGVDLAKPVETSYGVMTVGELLSESQSPATAKFVDKVQGKAA